MIKMTMVTSKNALPTIGALYITISFKVLEVKNRSFISDGNSRYVNNVRKHRTELLKNAIYNAIKKEFPNRTVTAYDILIIEYHYTYYLNNYQIEEYDKKQYETFRDVETNKKKKYVIDKYMIKDNYIRSYRQSTDGAK